MSSINYDIIYSIVQFLDFTTLINFLRCNCHYYNTKDKLLLDSVHKAIEQQATIDLSVIKLKFSNSFEDVFRLGIDTIGQYSFEGSILASIFCSTQKITNKDVEMYGLVKEDILKFYIPYIFISPIKGGDDIIGVREYTLFGVPEKITGFRSICNQKIFLRYYLHNQWLTPFHFLSGTVYRFFLFLKN